MTGGVIVRECIQKEREPSKHVRLLSSISRLRSVIGNLHDFVDSVDGSDTVVSTTGCEPTPADPNEYTLCRVLTESPDDIDVLTGRLSNLTDRLYNLLY
jgi:hypothetical protein